MNVCLNVSYQCHAREASKNEGLGAGVFTEAGCCEPD